MTKEQTLAEAGWAETSERCQVLLDALEEIRDYCKIDWAIDVDIVHDIADKAIKWTPTMNETL